MISVETEQRQEIVQKVKTRKALNSLQYSPNGVDVINGYSKFGKNHVSKAKTVNYF
jgi:hypothetical protein